MKTPLLIAVALTATAATTAVQAKTSSPAEFRGYEKCVAAAEDESQGLRTKRSYLVNKQGENTNYFINGTRWESGDRAQVRISCETTDRGHTLLSALVEPGRWVQDKGARVRVELAAQ